MPTCPNGHQSAADDWCEVCGHRMTGAPAAPPGAVPPSAPPTGGGYGYPGPSGGAPSHGYGFPPPQGGQQGAPQGELCPQCGTPREAQAPFCEECRYNFLTHSPTTYVPPHVQQGPPPPPSFPQHTAGGQPGPQGPGPATGAGPAAPPPPPPPSFPQHLEPGRERFEYEMSRPSQVNRPAEPLSPEPLSPEPLSPEPLSPEPPAPGPGPSYGGPPQGRQQPTGDWLLSPPGGQTQQAAPPAPTQPFTPQGPHQPPAPQGPQPAHQPGPAGQVHQAPQAPGQPVPGSPHQQQPNGAPQGGPGGSWVAVIAPDREYFAAMMGRSGPEASGLNLPAYAAEQQLPLTGNQVTIGRRRNSTGKAPDIDLARPPEDPGVSHQHAVLVQQPDGSWSVVDQDSTNGTTINGGEEPIQPFIPVPLRSGDRVHVGAWTTITVHRT